MAAGVQHNAHQIAVKVGRIGPEVHHRLANEHTRQCHLVAGVMKLNTPKFQSLLTNSVHVEARGALDATVRPGADYSEAREHGTRPGRGLPRFSDPKAAAIIAWLQSKAFAGRKTPRRGTVRAVLANLELRDRYQGLSWHVFRKGTKATPFVKPTADQMAVPVATALLNAAREGVSEALKGKS